MELTQIALTWSIASSDSFPDWFAARDDHTGIAVQRHLVALVYNRLSTKPLARVKDGKRIQELR